MNTPAAPHQVIAIDGPAASGKSSVARELANRLGFIYVNSGAMYRAITWYVLDRGIDPADSNAVAQLIGNAQLQCDLDGAESRITIDGVDPSPHLREVGVNRSVSPVSSVPVVRELLGARMHAYAAAHDVVMEGRDIGSVVFPHTPYKFYIDASPEVRSQRRAAQGQTDQIAVRDRADSSRNTAPLTVAQDAEVIDSSDLTIGEVVDRIVTSLRARGFKPGADRVASSV